MKKVLFAGALAACMALSSAAFAADVEFGSDGITGTYDKEAGTVSVATIPDSLTNGADQLTLVILDGDIETSASITKEMIQYIDQDSKSATDLFKSMGLLDGLTAGKTYTLRMGSDNSAAFAEAKFTVVADTPTTKEIYFYVGDVNSANGTESSDEANVVSVEDAVLILNMKAGAAKKVGTSTYSIGDKIVDTTGKVFYVGDVNSANDTAATDEANVVSVEDAVLILNMKAGAAKKVGTSTHSIGDKVTLTVPVTE